jgi:choline-sulfatase
MRKTGILISKTCYLAFLLVACDRQPAPRPNVLLVTIDTLRADRLGCYGFGLARTANLDRLAREGVRCANDATVAPITLPAHTSILTGLYPPAHGIRDNGAYAVSDSVVTLAERLKAAGYETQAFVSAAVLDRRYNLGQGFDGYDDDLTSENEPQLFMIRDRPAPRTASRVVRWLTAWGSRPHRPFFLWVHFFDPHQPYEPHTRQAPLSATPYDAEITTADEGVGTLREKLTALGQLDNTLLVVTADHGESLGEHEEKTHALFIYDATIHVPLLWRYPAALPAGKVYDAPVSAVDITPTILSALDLPGDKAVQGLSLWQALRGKAAAPHRPQYCESLLAQVGFGMAPLFGLRADGFKLIRAPRPELYDLANDPRELTNLLAAIPTPPPAAAQRSQAMGAALDELLADSARRAPPQGPSILDRESQEMLMALGYLAPSGERAAVAGMDPKDGIKLYNSLEEARHHAQRNDWAGSKVRLEALIDESPRNTSALNILALAEAHLGDDKAAERTYEASLAIDPKQFRVQGLLGQMALMRGDLDLAASRYKQALALTPGFSEAMGYLSYIAERQGKAAEAKEWLVRAEAADPAFARIYRRLGDLDFLRGDYRGALLHYQRLLAGLPEHFVGLMQASLSAHHLHDEVSANAYLDKAERARPDSWLPHFNRACYRVEAKDPEGALAALTQAAANGLNDVAQLDDNDTFAALRHLPAFLALRQQVLAAPKPHPRRR